MKCRLRTWTSIALLGALLAPAAIAAGEDDVALTVRHRSTAWTYTHEQLMAMATESLRNLRDTHDKPAIPLERLLLEETGLDLEDIEMIVALRGSGQPVILRGDYLDHLPMLVLASGEDKLDGTPHEWALAAENEATYDALKPAMGSRRKHGVYRIDITPRYRSD